MFLRRLFYDSETGAVLYSYCMQGDITIPNAEKDKRTVYSLKNYCGNISYLEWRKKDADLENNFRRASTVFVQNRELVFDFSPRQPHYSQQAEKWEDRSGN